jgi:predicted hydrocarbon binding protein
MSIFEELMLARQISFQDGRVELTGQRVVISPSAFFGAYTKSICDSPELVGAFYRAAKQAMTEGFGKDVGKAYGFSFSNYLDWFVKLAKLSGWGKIEWQESDEKKHTGIISAEGSPVAAYLKGKIASPCDHVIRGLMAGGASSAYKLDLDIVETECEALGAAKCLFVIDTAENLRKRHPDLAKLQLGESGAKA